jgi:hypothetical protein
VPQWGKYGIISEIEWVLIGVPSVQCSNLVYSIFSKAPEFSAWLVEERKINPETISKEQNKKEFAKYVEDYNTGESLYEISIFST